MRILIDECISTDRRAPPLQKPPTHTPPDRCHSEREGEESLLGVILKVNLSPMKKRSET